MVKSEIKIGLPLMVPDLVYKFQIIFLRVTEQKPNGGHTDGWMDERTNGHGNHLMPLTPNSGA